MHRHLAYWTDHMNRSRVVFGPVMNPGGVYGIGVVQAEAEVHAFAANDPAAATRCASSYPPPENLAIAQAVSTVGVQRLCLKEQSTPDA